MKEEGAEELDYELEKDDAFNQDDSKCQPLESFSLKP